MSQASTRASRSKRPRSHSLVSDVDPGPSSRAAPKARIHYAIATQFAPDEQAQEQDAPPMECYEEGANSEETESEGEVSETGEGNKAQGRQVITKTKTPTFSGFTDETELIFFDAIAATRPFAAQHGQKADAWSAVAKYLLDYDTKEKAAGRLAVFERVNKRVCQEKWNKVYEDRANRLASLRVTSVQNPTIDKRWQKIAPLYELDLEARKEAKDRKQKITHAKVQKATNKLVGTDLLERSRALQRPQVPHVQSILPPLVRSDSVDSTQSFTLTQQVNISSPLQARSPVGIPPFAPGFYSGSESEAPESPAVALVTSPSIHSAWPQRKRAMVDYATEQIQIVINLLHEQSESQRLHFALMRKDMEERMQIEKRREEQEAERLKMEAERLKQKHERDMARLRVEQDRIELEKSRVKLEEYRLKSSTEQTEKTTAALTVMSSAFMEFVKQQSMKNS